MIPVLEVGGLRIPTHDLLSVVAVLVGLALYCRSLRQARMLDDRIVLISLAAVMGGVVGARVVTSWEVVDEVTTAGLPLSYVLTHGPRSVIGGLAGGYLAIVVSKRALGYGRSTGDHYAAAIALALAIGRVGCFLSELPLGTPTDLPWGMQVSSEAAAAFPRCPGCGGPMHPSMLYEIGFNLAAFGLLSWRGRLLPVQGDTVKLYLLAYGVFRFGVEFVRGNETQAFGLTGPQLVVIPFLALLLAHFARQLRRDAYRVPTPPRALVAEGGSS